MKMRLRFCSCGTLSCQPAVRSTLRDWSNLFSVPNLCADTLQEPLPKTPEPGLHGISLPVRVVIIEENSSVFADGRRKVLREEVANPAHRFFSAGRGLGGRGVCCPRRVWIGSEAMDKDDAVTCVSRMSI